MLQLTEPPPWNVWPSPLKGPHSIFLHLGVTQPSPPNNNLPIIFLRRLIMHVFCCKTEWLARRIYHSSSNSHFIYLFLQNYYNFIHWIACLLQHNIGCSKIGCTKSSWLHLIHHCNCKLGLLFLIAEGTKAPAKRETALGQYEYNQ